MTGYFDQVIVGMVPMRAPVTRPYFKRRPFPQQRQPSSVQFPFESHSVGPLFNYDVRREQDYWRPLDLANMVRATTVAPQLQNDHDLLSIRLTTAPTDPETVHSTQSGLKYIIIILSIIFLVVFCMALIMCIVRARSRRKIKEARKITTKRMPSLSTDKYVRVSGDRQRRKSGHRSPSSHVVLHVHVSIPNKTNQHQQQEHSISRLQVPSEINLSTDNIDMESPPPPYPGEQELQEEEHLPYTVEEA